MAASVFLEHCNNTLDLPHRLLIKLLQPSSEAFSPLDLNLLDLIRCQAYFEPVLRYRVFALHEHSSDLSACVVDTFSAIWTIRNLLFGHAMIFEGIARRRRPPAILFTTLENIVLIDMATLREYMNYTLTHC